jgi:hypothetical protein
VYEMLDLQERTETAVVLDLTDDMDSELRSAWQRAAWLLELADVQELSHQRFVAAQLQTDEPVAKKFAPLGLDVEGGADYLPIAA